MQPNPPSERITDQLIAMSNQGFSMIPLVDRKNKKPRGRWGHFQSRRAGAIEILQWYSGKTIPEGVAVVCGHISGNLVLLDFDTKHDDSTCFSAFCALIDQRSPGLLNRLVEETSPSGGKHLYFRWTEGEKIIKCWKLAQSEEYETEELDDQGKKKKVRDTWIETKAEGGYSATWPTWGYTWTRGALKDAPTISAEEIDLLLDTAREFTAFREVHSSEHRSASKDLPGGHYAREATIKTVTDVLLKGGWTPAGERDSETGPTFNFWRPGKDSGSVSGNLAQSPGEPPLFYVYSTASCFPQAQKAYDPFGVYTFVLFEGKFSSAARSLRRQGFGVIKEEVTKPDQLELAQDLKEHLKGEAAFDADLGEWRLWRGTHWQGADVVDLAQLHDRATEFVHESGVRVTSVNQISSILTQVQHKVTMRFVPKDDVVPLARRKIVAFKNGQVEVTNPALPLGQHRKEDYIIDYLPYSLDPQGSFPLIQAFFDDSLPDHEAQLAYATHLGLALLGDTTFHKMLVLVGGTNSGKSTAYHLANLVAGNPMRSGPGSKLFSTDVEGMRSRATWNWQLLCAMDELPADALRNEDLAKAMTGHNAAEMRQMHQREIMNNNWRPKILCTCNEVPRLTDRTAAMKRRLLFLNFPNVRLDTDPTLIGDMALTFVPELGAFTAHCLRLAHAALKTHAYPISEEMVAKGEQAEIEGNPLKMFVATNAVFDESAFTPTEVLFSAYIGFCAHQGLDKPLSLNRFLRSMLDRYGAFNHVTSSQRRVEGFKNALRGLAGIRLRTETDEPAQFMF